MIRAYWFENAKPAMRQVLVVKSGRFAGVFTRFWKSCECGKLEPSTIRLKSQL